MELVQEETEPLVIVLVLVQAVEVDLVPMVWADVLSVRENFLAYRGLTAEYSTPWSLVEWLEGSGQPWALVQPHHAPLSDQEYALIQV